MSDTSAMGVGRGIYYYEDRFDQLSKRRPLRVIPNPTAIVLVFDGGRSFIRNLGMESMDRLLERSGAFAVNQSHDVELTSSRVDGLIVDRNDAGVFQICSQFDFRQKAASDPGLLCQFLANPFESDESPAGPIKRAEYLAHPTASNLFEY
jgi:hypothetical protein